MAGQPDLSPNESSEWVQYLQQLLNHYYQQTVVPESGEYDETTVNAVRHFRAQNGLPESDSVDSDVWDLLTQDQPQPQPQADPAPSGGGGGDGGDGSGGAPPSGNDGQHGSGPGTDPAAEPEADTDGCRPLTSEEVSEAYVVFGSELDTSAIQVCESSVMSVGGYARTLPDEIYFPVGTLSNPPSGFMKWLIHELGHCWQYQQGASVPGLIVSALGGDYDYGGEQGLRDAAAAGQPFSDWGYEEQASILADYWELMGGDTSAYDPYIESVKNGTWQSPP
ncbi:MAG TPA: peptidoglycan-binding domain-containing protein [Actinokineospora sp.]|nr:peptidoglycan-binding domain-containing protein [Actinokineospora sp.]